MNIPVVGTREVANAARRTSAHIAEYNEPETRMIAAVFNMFAEHLDEGATHVAPVAVDTYAGDRIATSVLLDKAAHTIAELLSGRGVDRRNGYSWDNLVRDLYDRAAAFKNIEDTP